MAVTPAVASPVLLPVTLTFYNLKIKINLPKEFFRDCNKYNKFCT